MWFSGCGACVYVAQELPKVEEAFAGDTNVVFMSVSIDRSRQMWLNSTNPEGNGYHHYTTPTTLYAYTGGTGENNSFIHKYVPANSYPTLLVVDRQGKLYSSHPPQPWPGTDGAKKLEAMLRDVLRQ
jgi:thiol-disulfide isomerase/thioredoxin